MILDSIGANSRVGSWPTSLEREKIAGMGFRRFKITDLRRGMWVRRKNLAETPGGPPELRSDSCLVFSCHGRLGLDAVMKIEGFF
jgi:hypothetical protein